MRIRDTLSAEFSRLCYYGFWYAQVPHVLAVGDFMLLMLCDRLQPSLLSSFTFILPLTLCLTLPLILSLTLSLILPPPYPSPYPSPDRYAPEMELVMNSIDFSQRHVTGAVELKLYKGNTIVMGRESPVALYRCFFF